MGSKMLIEIVRTGLHEWGYSFSEGCTQWGIFKHPGGKRIMLKDNYDGTITLSDVKKENKP